jgi:hypothetical protein
MTFGVPVTLIDMRAALRERCQLDTNDPRATNAILNRLINAALHRFQVANPNGWPWDFAEATVALTIGTDTIPLPIGTGAGHPTKIRYAVLQHPDGTWEYPLERTTRWDQLSRYPRDGEQGAPRTFALLGQSSSISGVTGMQVRLRPAPDLAYNLVIGGAMPSDDFVNDTDPATGTNDYMIGDWVDTLLDYAAYLVFRARGDLAEAMLGAEAGFNEAVIEARRTARVILGPGRGVNPLADDRELT